MRNGSIRTNTLSPIWQFTAQETLGDLVLNCNLQVPKCPSLRTPVGFLRLQPTPDRTLQNRHHSHRCLRRHDPYLILERLKQAETMNSTQGGRVLDDESSPARSMKDSDSALPSSV